MKDWLGNEYDVGDLVIYAAQSGSRVNMVLAQCLRLQKEKRFGAIALY